MIAYSLSCGEPVLKNIKKGAETVQLLDRKAIRRLTFLSPKGLGSVLMTLRGV
jgi:hypothetical protein